MKNNVLRLLRENAGFMLFLAGMFVFRSAVADWNHIPSGSMEPTLQVGDRVLVDHRAYAWRVPFTTIQVAQRGVPQTGDVVTFRSPRDGERLIKRVVATAGARIAGRGGVLFVDGNPVGLAGQIEFGPVEVPPAHVFVMGDNRDSSLDSRFWGPLPVENIYGKALKVVFSLAGPIPRGDRWWLDLSSGRP